MTHRLLEKNHKVTLVDAGSHGSSHSRTQLPSAVKNNPLHFWKFQIPSALTYNLRAESKANWHYETTPQPLLNGRSIDQPRGKCLGGSSNLNAMVYVRGNKGDFDSWPPFMSEEKDAIGWGYEDCLPYFKKAQTSHTPNCTADMKVFKGFDGPLEVTNGAQFSKHVYPGKPEKLLRSPLHDALLEAGAECGYKSTPDSNGYSQEGFGPMDQTVGMDGARCSTEVAYLAKNLDNPNLTIVQGHAKELLFDGVAVKGCSVATPDGQSMDIMADETISSLGSIGTPQLLMLSGVGPSDHLSDHGIETVVDLPVGQNLQDHLEFYMQYRTTARSLYPVGNWLPYPHLRVATGLEWFLSGAGLAASNQFEVGAFLRTGAGVQWPDIQYHFICGAVIGQEEFVKENAMQVHVGTLRPAARGTVTLKSKDYRDAPLIDPRYLTGEDDLHGLVRGFEMTREVMRAPAMEKYNSGALNFDESFTYSEAAEWIKANCHSAYHPCGTASLGPVCLSDGRVRGTRGLRVVDASLMPNMTSGNLNAPVIMMAEKIAEAVVEEGGGRKKERVEMFEGGDWMNSQR
eukprot:CAMPEP_0197571130 /NCGR_PEP_ID=MMETSP1320-20131121/41796_1 /TAXON_ID=91990 /ORGANISM="Bolidomonas sp., Strain RCC2347" /LENGTH=570 /DNA_ID=CAMNT_0043133613 /DNA_START=1179 /DNA_END=2891 /DNA_ORIENTATION=-